MINIIEEFNHFQKLIDNGEDRCTTFQEAPDFELEQYYSKRQELYSQLLISLLELQSIFIKTNKQSIDFFQLLSSLSDLQSNLIEANNPNPKNQAVLNRMFSFINQGKVRVKINQNNLFL